MGREQVLAFRPDSLPLQCHHALTITDVDMVGGELKMRNMVAAKSAGVGLSNSAGSQEATELQLPMGQAVDIASEVGDTGASACSLSEQQPVNMAGGSEPGWRPVVGVYGEPEEEKGLPERFGCFSLEGAGMVPS